MHKGDTEALQTWYLNSQQLLSIFSVPDSDFVDGGSCKDIRIVEWKGNIINFLIMASIS